MFFPNLTKNCGESGFPDFFFFFKAHSGMITVLKHQIYHLLIIFLEKLMLRFFLTFNSNFKPDGEAHLPSNGVIQSNT